MSSENKNIPYEPSVFIDEEDRFQVNIEGMLPWFSACAEYIADTHPEEEEIPFLVFLFQEVLLQFIRLRFQPSNQRIILSLVMFVSMEQQEVRRSSVGVPQSVSVSEIVGLQLLLKV